jgi:hypothetical protein
MKPEPYKDVSGPQGIPAATPAACGARIYLPMPQTSHRERDDAYPVVGQLSDTVRVIHCKDGIQWVLQRRRGDQWQGVAFCRSRAALIREATRALGHTPVALQALPEHHDGFVEIIPRCKVCGRIATKPTSGLPRHMFCTAVRKRRKLTLVVESPLPQPATKAA